MGEMPYKSYDNMGHHHNADLNMVTMKDMREQGQRAFKWATKDLTGGTGANSMCQFCRGARDRGWAQ